MKAGIAVKIQGSAIMAVAVVSTVLLGVLAGGCGRSGRLGQGAAGTSLGPGDVEKSLESEGRQRKYIVHLPPSYDGSHPFPLVLVLHGGTGNALQTEYMSGMSQTTDQGGFIAVYPNGTGLLGDRILTWNVGFGFAYALRNNVNDVGFLRQLIGTLGQEYSIDPKRVYCAGISNGAIMSYLLASEASDLIAAIGPVAGASAGRRSGGAPLLVFPAPAYPVSVMEFHGGQDRMIPYDGGAGTGLTNAVYLPVQETIDLWVSYDGCSQQPTTETSANGNVIRQAYGGGRDGSEVVLYTINDGTHSWPGGKTVLRSAAMKPTSDISASQVMWEFFLRHPKP
jgi:polyhydroxybutyrate depolymerase